MYPEEEDELEVELAAAAADEAEAMSRDRTGGSVVDDIWAVKGTWVVGDEANKAAGGDGDGWVRGGSP